MNRSIVSFNTKNNTYHLIKISKTTYEEEQECEAELKYMIMQKIFGIVLTVISLIMLINGLTPAILSLILGVAVTLTKDHVLSL